MEKNISGELINPTLKKIAIVGPESTGKTSLSEYLADYFSTTWVPEFAREYLSRQSSIYTADDLIKIAEGQVKAEKELSKNANKILLCDTTLMVIKVWMEHSFGYCDPWILKKYQDMEYDLYLLCNTDVAWVEDPQREHPDMRDYFFEKYRSELENRGLPYQLISGQYAERKKKAVKIVSEMI